MAEAFPQTAFVLCAGFGTRLMPLTKWLPKPLFPIVCRPALEVIVERLARAGVKSFFLNAHHLSEMIRAEAQRLSASLGVEIEVAVESGGILGTAGGLGNLFAFAGRPCGTILVHNGDVVEDLDLLSAYEAHLRLGAAVTMVLVDRPNPGSVVVEDGFVVGFRGGVGLTYAGVAFFEPEVLASFPRRFSSLVEELLPWVARRAVRAAVDDRFWHDFGTLADYLDLHRRVLFSGELALPGCGAGVFVAESARVAPDASLAGFVAICPRAVVPKGAALENVVVWSEARLKPKRYVNAIVTPHAAVEGLC